MAVPLISRLYTAFWKPMLLLVFVARGFWAEPAMPAKPLIRWPSTMPGLMNGLQS